jgi:hypothetical protein
VPILPPAHPLGGGSKRYEIYFVNIFTKMELHKNYQVTWDV